MRRLRFFVRKTLQTVLMLWLILTFLFILFHSLPGEFGDQFLVSGASGESVEALQEKWGLNDPLHVQYQRYVVNFATGDFGTSLQYRQPVFEAVKGQIFNSFILAFPAITGGYVIGSLVGSVMGTNRGSKLESYGLPALFVLGTIPSFFLAILFAVVFAGWLDLFPTSGMTSAGFTLGEEAPWWQLYLTSEFLVHYILPFSVIFLRYTFLPVVLMRTSVVETLGQDFIEYQRITGLPKLTRLKSVIKHSMLPVITMYPLTMTQAIGGLVLIEIVFNWPGIGFELVQAVFARDFPLVQFVFFFIAAAVVVMNVIVDLLYGVIDPRVSIDD